LAGNTYTGTAGGQTVFTLTLNPATGAYTYQQLRPLDHADGSNANDVITLSFGYTATDTDGDTATGAIVINVRDDAPIANDDTISLGTSVLSTTGNVTTNDVAGFDTPATVTQVTLNGVNHAVAATGNTTIVGTFGTLVINAAGAYTYTSANTTLGTDRFVYTLRDADGDRDTATLALTVTDIDSNPVVTTPGTSTIDETNLATTNSVAGAVVVNIGADSGS
ncbi:MAG: VCBS domain-containing protein, partial [Alphaproteobacteria bacterium]|nr:VCBS domain-containing protein [Alphaproteobacteria bacterium]